MNFKLGILMDDLSVDVHLKRLIFDLKKNPKIDLILLKNDFKKPTGFKKLFLKIKYEGFFRVINIVFFNFVIYLESFLTKIFSKKYRNSLEVTKIDEKVFSKKINLKPNFFNYYFVSYEDADIEKIRSNEIDLILRGNGTGIFKGKILDVATHGLISAHHGDNRWNRGGPPGFWEVLLKKDETGFIFQICTEKLDAGKVIFRGGVATKPFFLINMMNLYFASFPFLRETINKIVDKNSLPKIEKKIKDESKLYKTPNFKDSFKYIFSRLAFIFERFFLRHILRKKQVWSIAYQHSNFNNLSFKSFKKIQNKPGHFYADPFCISIDEVNYIFVEDYSFKTQKGKISLLIEEQNNIRTISNIIDEDFHLSFPYIFEYKSKLYMVPESHENNDIRLYECIDFPAKWNFKKTIKKNINAVDSMIFKKDNLWWLFTNIADPQSQDYSSQLHAFFSDDPVNGKWLEHKENPIIFSAKGGRNGGIIKNDDSYLRICQNYGFAQYGKSFSISKITKLNEHQYDQEELMEVSANFFDNLSGCHHLSSSKNFTVIDCVKNEKI